MDLRPGRLRCCQLVQRGRHVAAAVVFDGGHVLPIADGRRWHHLVGDLVLVDADARRGHVRCHLGPVRSIRATMQGLLAEHGRIDADDPLLQAGDLDGALAGESLASGIAPGIPDARARSDLRSLPTVAIDPADARDRDDALSLEQLDDAGGAGRWRLHVHIADVAAYVQPGSGIDRRAEALAMTTYLPGTHAPMLPEQLAAGACSLHPGEDRAAFTFELVIDADGGIRSFRARRSIVRVDRALSYERAEELLARGQDPLLGGLDELARARAARRRAAGSLELELPEVQVRIEDDRPVEARLRRQGRAHALVEEAMVAANVAVGRMLERRQAVGIWRCHDHPEPASVIAVLEELATAGLPVASLGEEASGSDAARAAAATARMLAERARAGEPGMRTASQRLLRGLQRATYRAHAGVHSGLAVDAYAHSTSPIRRYPDLVVHRSIGQAIGSDAGQRPPTGDELAEVAAHVSAVELSVVRLERIAERICLAALAHDRWMDRLAGGSDAIEQVGEVVGLVGAGAFVRFEEVFEGFVPARLLAGQERVELADDGLSMVASRSRRRLRIGDTLRVAIERIDELGGRIDLAPVGSWAGSHR